MIRGDAAAVRSGVIALKQPNHPLRLAALLAASVAFFAIVAAAAYAVAYIVEDQRSGDVAGVSVEPTQSDLNLPPGLIAVRRVEDAAEFESLAGFAPFIPDRLPATTSPDPVLSVSLPDDNGHRAGRVSYSPNDGAAVDGITGPLIVLVEAKGMPGEGVDSVLKRITEGSGRALAATLPCGDLVIDAQFYYGPDPEPEEPFVTPYMVRVAEDFLAAMRRQCAE